jgi:hypothetical protein
MNESCILTSGAECANDSTMSTIGALASIIPFTILIIGHGDTVSSSRERHIMSSPLFVFFLGFSGGRALRQRISCNGHI